VINHKDKEIDSNENETNPKERKDRFEIQIRVVFQDGIKFFFKIQIFKYFQIFKV
jgi:hypothetical protein